jgi:hypothetical protein
LDLIANGLRVAQNLSITPLLRVGWRNLDSVDLQEKGEIHNPLWFWDGNALWIVSFRQKNILPEASVSLSPW